MKMIRYSEHGAYIRADKIVQILPTFRNKLAADPEVVGCTIKTEEGECFSSSLLPSDIVRQIDREGSVL